MSVPWRKERAPSQETETERKSLLGQQEVRDRVSLLVFGASEAWEMGSQVTWPGGSPEILCGLLHTGENCAFLHVAWRGRGTARKK